MRRSSLIVFFMFVISIYGRSQTWNAVGNGFFNGGPTCLLPQEKLYIGTSGISGFSLAGASVNGIASFDGSKIDSLGSGLGGVTGSALDGEWYGGKFVVGGNFTYAGTTQWSILHSKYIAAWDSVNGWSSITPNGSVDNFVNCVEKYNGDLYIGGLFINVNNVSCLRIAKWNGTSWSNVSGGFIGNCNVNCMAVYHNQLYVGGQICLPNGPNNNYYNIVRWNGSQWDSVGCKLNAPPLALVVDSIRDVLYVGGYFTSAGSVQALGVAMWNDTTWSPLGNGTDTLSYTQCLAMFNSELYAGGGYSTITSQGDTLNYIYKFNGTKWVGVDGGANSNVSSLGVYHGNLFVGGAFWQVGYSISARRIACYGTTCPIGLGVADHIPPVPFNLFPNPNSDVLHIESEETKQMIFRLISGDGKIVAETKFMNGLDYSTRGLAKGVYSVQICLEDGSRCHIEKVVVK